MTDETPNAGDVFNIYTVDAAKLFIELKLNPDQILILTAFIKDVVALTTVQHAPILTILIQILTKTKLRTKQEPATTV